MNRYAANVSKRKMSKSQPTAYGAYDDTTKQRQHLSLILLYLQHNNKIAR